MHPTVLRTTLIRAVAFTCLLASAAPAVAQEPANDAVFVSVQNPITSDAFRRIKNEVNARVNEAGERRVETVVFDFNPSDKPASTADFGPCFELADFIAGLKGKATIAFVHGPVTGHTVLPVLACMEVVMSKKGVIGPVLIEGMKPLDGVRESAYRKLVNPDRWPIVQKMFDPTVNLVRGPARIGGGRIYANGNDAAQVARIAGNPEPVKGGEPGHLASYPASEAHGIELAKGLAETRKDVAELYGLPPSSVRDDPLQGRAPVAFQWTLKGDVDSAMRESVNRVVRDVRKKGGNVLIFVMNCGGTDLDAARGLADDLIQAQSGPDAVQMIAFVPESAPDAATVVALGCSEIVMARPKADPNSEVKEATIGNFDHYLKSAKPAAIDAQRQSLRALAESRGYPGVLVDGMLDPGLEIVRARGTNANRNKTHLMTRAEFDSEKKINPGAWADAPVVIKPKNIPFQLTATQAAELGLARFVVPSRDVKDVCAIYGVSEAKDPDPGWVDRFAEFLRIPVVTVLLVMVGFIGLILELKVPGLTIPGVLAALCFILVFWSQSRYDTIFMLAILLFILGLTLLAMEIFVLPGFGVCGICGVGLMLSGLGLVTLEKVPTNMSEGVGLALRMSYFLFALIGAFVAAFVVARFLPQVPGANRLLLAPPTEQPHGAELVLPGASEALGLLGAIGTSTTPLRPAGVVRFGDKFVDVVSDGGFIAAGTRVQVIDVEGTRIVVKEV